MSVVMVRSSLVRLSVLKSRYHHIWGYHDSKQCWSSLLINILLFQGSILFLVTNSHSIFSFVFFYLEVGFLSATFGSSCSSQTSASRVGDAVSQSDILFFSIYFLSSGTRGEQHATERMLSYAVYIANLFFLTSDTLATVVKDVDISAQQIGQ